MCVGVIFFELVELGTRKRIALEVSTVEIFRLVVWKTWLAYLQLRSIRFVVLVTQCTISIAHGSSRMQPIVRFLYFLQLLRVIGMLIRRETTPKQGTNVTVDQEQDCCFLPACHVDYAGWSYHVTFASTM